MWKNRVEYFRRRAEIAQWTADNYSTEVMVDGMIAGIKSVGVN